MIDVLIAISQLTGGGAERVATVWANELASLGYSVSVITYFRKSDEYTLSGAIKVRSISDTQTEYLQMSFAQRLSKMRTILKSVRPDYVISFLPTMQVWVMLASVGMKQKRIETIRINPWRVHMKNKVQYSLWMLCYKTCSKIILQSSDQAPFFSKRQQKKSVIIPNPISAVYKVNCRDVMQNSPRKFVAAGRIDEQKNYPLMIRAFSEVCKRHPEVTLCIYGTGDAAYVEKIQGLIVSEGMLQNIFLMGRVPHMEQEYKKYDAYLMTSDYEGLPNALAEAMASRLVCISTDCKTGPRDLIDHGVNGFLVPVSDAMALRKQIEVVLCMPTEQLDQIASNARNKVLTYCSEENSIKRVCKLFE